MNNRPRSPLEGQATPPTGPGAAVLGAPLTAVGEPKGAARQGVRTALCSDPHGADGRRAVRPLRNPQEGRAAA